MEAEAMEPCVKKCKIDKEKCEENGNVKLDQVLPITNGSHNENEKKFGIDSVINKNQRFSGIIKQRYSDFLVRESDSGENLVYLTDTDHIDNQIVVEKSSSGAECPITDEALLEKINQFVTSGDKSKKLVLDAESDKDHRTLVHMYLKDHYKEIDTNTVTNDDGESCIEISFKSEKSNRKPGWPKNLPKFCHFVLFKENRDTMECMNVLAKLVHAKASNFTYAGTKDRRAVTIQRVAVKRVYSKQLSNLKLKNMAVGNFCYKDEDIRLGDLSGNKFSIVIRDIRESDEQINICCKSLSEEGFINYFGLQRFGTGNISTCAIGKALLQSNFEAAINLILHYNESDADRFQSSAKKIWQAKKNAKKAFSAVRSKTSIESKVLEKLSKQGVNYNYYNAFMALPRNNRLLYLHSYQSLIWNKMVSRRLEELGIVPCLGDLVLCKEKNEDGHAIAKALTEDELANGSHTIYDIVLPLPGYDILYPENKIGHYYRDLLSSDEIDIDGMKNKIKDISLPGTYRKILVKPKDMSWKICMYGDYKISLIHTDLEVLKNKENSVETNPMDNIGDHKAVKIEMTLPTSCYATSALREILISDSSFKSQTELNEKFEMKNI